MELSEAAQKIVEVAREHDGIYHLARRFRGRKPYEPKNDLDREYDACQEIVNKKLARWQPHHPAIRMLD